MSLDLRNNVGPCIKKEFFFHRDARMITREPEETFWKIECWSAATGRKHLQMRMRAGPTRFNMIDRSNSRTKGIIITIYDSFLKWLGIPWEPPKYKPTKRLPFIPTEEEIDQLIARAGRRLAPLLQLLKETGMRRGEAAMLEWTDIDTRRRTVTITPEKGSNPRMLPLSEKAVAMLTSLPKKSHRIFATVSSITSNYYLQRRTLAAKLKNPRLLKISLHTFRHWKATMEYHKTRDLLHVQQVLGHCDIKSTMTYINLEQALFQVSNDEFHVKTAKTVEEACKLAEVGFEHFDTIDDVHLYRKRK